MTNGPLRYIGLMSGTSMDGIDAGLLCIEDHFRLAAGLTLPYPPAVHGRLCTAVEHSDDVGLDELGQLNTALGECFAEAVLKLLDQVNLKPADIAAIGSHGQTVRHQPAGPFPFTMQIGDPAVIAARTGITTVSDFRSRDVALGGQGAPLAPAFHRAAFASSDEDRVVINIGGISNMTALHADGSVSGHDIGPGNVLMDSWIQQHDGSRYDAEGAWARTGRVQTALLTRFLTEPYFHCPPPKSTGRELFNLQWLTRHLVDHPQDTWPAQDIQATLCELSARTVADAIDRYAPAAKRCLICGGGARNGLLMDRLEALLPERVVEATDAHGLGAEWVEATAFAWLAWRTLNNKTGNLRSVTGASQSAVLGTITPR